ncbi:alpha/beta hydrolase [Variovorax sp.]|uniref:alpha/beta hydrolase n=1 Tax=Variovorax sp. TaxID=1871043 RepID=UPI002D73D56F|nr:alpha/beta hydrolase [Variovorax sp.]HYP85276.1 alpha/beta hydrolase [Variovorax sp.]
MTSATKIIAATAVALLAAVGAQAETYEGVHPLTSGRTRAEVQAEAVAVVGNPYSDAAYAGVTPLPGGAVDRAVVQQQAVAAAHNPTQNLDSKSFVNSQIPAQYTNGSLARRQDQQRQAAL